VGTASGTYNFPIRKQMAAIHCQGSTCLMPATKKHFKVTRLSSGAAKQKYQQNWLHVKIENDLMTTKSFALDSSGNAVSFYID
jgi:hypothetical protein